MQETFRGGRRQWHPTPVLLPGESHGRRCLGRKPPRVPQLEETAEMPPSSRAEGLLFLPGLESNHESSLKSEEEAGLP